MARPYAFLVAPVIAMAALLVACSNDRISPPIADGLFRNPFGETCAEPCLFGAVLGQTTLDDGLQVVGAHPRLAGIEGRPLENEVRFYSPEFNVTLRSSDVPIVDEVWVSIDDESITLRDLLVEMGEPASVHYFLRPGRVSGGYMSWMYDGITATLWLDEPSIDLDQPIENLHLRSSDDERGVFPVFMNAIYFLEYRLPERLSSSNVEEHITHPSCRRPDHRSGTLEPCPSSISEDNEDGVGG